MANIIDVDGLSILIVRKRIKRLNLKIKGPDGRIEMSVPVHVTDAEVAKFVRERRDWIDRNVARVRVRGAAHPEPANAQDKERLRGELKARIAGMLPAIEQRTQLFCSGWTVRDMHTRWGSCNTATNHINLSLMLATRSDEELEYVIIHELVHTHIDNHGEEFKKYMDELCPNWRAIRKSLKY